VRRRLHRMAHKDRPGALAAAAACVLPVMLLQSKRCQLAVVLNPGRVHHCLSRVNAGRGYASGDTQLHMKDTGLPSSKSRSTRAASAAAAAAGVDCGQPPVRAAGWRHGPHVQRQGQ
jgi:hypothetical protein